MAQLKCQFTHQYSNYIATNVTDSKYYKYYSTSTLWSTSCRNHRQTSTKPLIYWHHPCISHITVINLNVSNLHISKVMAFSTNFTFSDQQVSQIQRQSDAHCHEKSHLWVTFFFSDIYEILIRFLPYIKDAINFHQWQAYYIFCFVWKVHNLSYLPLLWPRWSPFTTESAYISLAWMNNP